MAPSNILALFGKEERTPSKDGGPLPIALMWAGFGMMGTAAAALILRQGGGVVTGAALLSGIFLAALGGRCRFIAELPRRPLPALAAPAAVLFSAAVLMPLIGLRATGLAGAALGLTGWIKIRAGQAHGVAAEPPPAWLLALAGAAAVAWARCLGLLWGHSFYAFCGLCIGAGAGTACGLWLKGRCAPILDAAGLPRRLFVFVSALAGLLGLCWLRFIGINAGAAEYLFCGLQGPGDLLFIVGQSTLALMLWSALLTMAWPAPPSAVGTSSGWTRASGALLAAAGPLAAWALIPRLGAAETAALCHLALAALSLAADRQPLLRRPVLSRIALVGLAFAPLMAWQCRDLFADVWLNRLNAAWAGGRYLARAEDGRELLAVYRFSSGVPVLLRDGAAWVNAPTEARREAHLPLLLQGSPRRILMLDVRNPLAIISAMAHGAEILAVDSHPGAKIILRSLSPMPWPPESPSVNGGRLSWTRADPRRYLRAAGPSFDAIIEELPFPAPGWSRLTTREAFQELRGRLTPAGLAALRLPAPYPPRDLAKTLRTARSVFAHVGGYELPGGYLLICSAQPLMAQPAALLARRNVFVQADDLRLEEDLPRLRWDDFSDMTPALAALKPGSDDRFSDFFQLPGLPRPQQISEEP